MKRLALVGLLVLAGCGGDTAPGTDLETGLRFEVQTTKGFGTTLTVSATRNLPAGVRTQLEGERVQATCEVPDTKVVSLPKRWADLDEPFSTTLQTRGDVDVEAEATACRLVLDGRTFARSRR